MLTNEQANQLDALEAALDNEYKNKKDAIRFMREFLSGFTPSNGGLLAGMSVVTSTAKSVPNLAPIRNNQSEPQLPPLDDEGPTLIGKVAEIMEQYAEERWTMRRMLAYLEQIQFHIRNTKPEASVSAALSKLAKLGRITAIRPGAGKTQGIYQWNSSYSGTAKTEDLEEESEDQELVET